MTDLAPPHRMVKEFIDASTARLALISQGGLGAFELHQQVDRPTQYTFLLSLDVYQTNSPRAWLEYRWRFRSLLGAQVVLSDKRSLVLVVSNEFASDELALEAFKAWAAEVHQEFQTSLTDRR